MTKSILSIFLVNECVCFLTFEEKGERNFTGAESRTAASMYSVDPINYTNEFGAPTHLNLHFGTSTRSLAGNTNFRLTDFMLDPHVWGLTFPKDLC